MIAAIDHTATLSKGKAEAGLGRRRRCFRGIRGVDVVGSAEGRQG